jgi:hypothetical protein
MSGEPPTAPNPSIHGSAVVIGEAAVVIRGASGAGKSQLALALLHEARRSGLFARLIGDDRLFLEKADGRVVVRGHPAIHGLIEERGSGLLPEIHEAAGLLRCLVDLVPAAPRLPASPKPTVEIAGSAVPKMDLQAGLAPQEGARRILAFLLRG